MNEILQALVLAGACWTLSPLAGAEEVAKAASASTRSHNAELLDKLPFADREDYASASRGLIAPFRDEIKDPAGRTVWNMGAYGFLDAAAVPDTVNPSLWRQAQLNANAGLFQVSERLYQLRGFDLANMTVIEGDSGLILIDPLMTTETAHAALEFYYQHRPRKPVVAVIYSHSHLDHFGGVRGVIDEADVKSGKVQVIAPAGFMEEAVSENLLAGNAMLRRAQYQAGSAVPRGERGQLDTGIGKSGMGAGTISLIAPSVLIGEPYVTRRIDGVDVEFQLTPGTEAPAEMNIYLPQFKALCIAENATHTLHNLLTPRGALVRDAKAWSQFLDASLARYGDKAEVLFAQHNWPTWGGAQVRSMLADQRDMYAYLNNQTLHLINQGLTPDEIAEAMQKLPGDLATKWYARGYYGSLSFNVRAVYQRYLGFYDGNPAHLDPLPPVSTAQHYVKALGGAERVLELMKAAVAEGDYRWAVELGNHLVFADPANQAALNAQADALEQLAYQSENALWRNMYLSAVQELRHGVAAANGARNATDMIRALQPRMFFELMAVRLDSDKAVGHDMTLNWTFTDLDQSFALTLRNGVLTFREDQKHAKPDASVSMSKATLDRIGMRQLDFPTALKQGEVKIEGDAGKLAALMGMLSVFPPNFAIVTP